MIKKLLIALVLAFPFVQVQSQNVNLSWGSDISSETNVLKILGKTETGHYALTNRKKKFFLEHFSGAAMTRDFTTELEFREEDGRKSELANIFYLDGQLSLFTVAYDKPNKDYHIYGYLLNEKGQITGTRKDIITVHVDKGRRRGKFSIELSRDRTKMLVLHSAPHKIKSSVWEWKVNMNVLSYDLQSIKTMSETFSLKEEKDYVNISNFIIDNSATVWMAVRQVGWSREHGMEITKSMTIYQYDPTNGFELVTIPVDIGDKKASSIGLATDPDGNLVGGGFYTERNPRGLFKYEGLGGSYFFRVNRQASELENVRLEAFGPEFAGRILSERKADKGKLVPNAFVPRQIIPRTDGGAVMVAEYYTVTITTDRATRQTTYYHGPLAVVSLNPDGKIDWVRALPKNQYYVKTETTIGIGLFAGGFAIGFGYWLSLSKDKTVYHSYMLAVKDDKLQFIYNDNPKNLEVEHTRDTNPLRGFKGAVPVAVEIDGSGNVSKDILREKDRSEVVLRPKIHYQEDYGDILIFGSKRSKDKFGVIQY